MTSTHIFNDKIENAGQFSCLLFLLLLIGLTNCEGKDGYQLIIVYLV